jgi:hypothetical protein
MAAFGLSSFDDSRLTGRLIVATHISKYFVLAKIVRRTSPVELTARAAVSHPWQCQSRPAGSSPAALAGSESGSAFGVFRGRPPFAPFAFAAALFALERWLPMREPTLIL